MDQQHSPEEITSLAKRFHASHRRTNEFSPKWEDLKPKQRAECEMLVAGRYEDHLEVLTKEELHHHTRLFILAGMVERAHTTRHHGEYTVARHSWGAAMLLFALYPGTPSANLIKAVLFHDVAEFKLGDLRGDAKWNHPALKAAYEEAELETLREDFPMAWDAISKLDENEQAWLRGVDALELLHWCAHQDSLGNDHVGEISDRVMNRLAKHPPPAEILKYLEKDK